MSGLQKKKGQVGLAFLGYQQVGGLPCYRYQEIMINQDNQCYLNEKILDGCERDFMAWRLTNLQRYFLATDDDSPLKMSVVPRDERQYASFKEIECSNLAQLSEEQTPIDFWFWKQKIGGLKLPPIRNFYRLVGGFSFDDKIATYETIRKHHGGKVPESIPDYYQLELTEQNFYGVNQNLVARFLDVILDTLEKKVGLQQLKEKRAWLVKDADSSIGKKIYGIYLIFNETETDFDRSLMTEKLLAEIKTDVETDEQYQALKDAGMEVNLKKYIRRYLKAPYGKVFQDEKAKWFLNLFVESYKLPSVNEFLNFAQGTDVDSYLSLDVGDHPFRQQNQLARIDFTTWSRHLADRPIKIRSYFIPIIEYLPNQNRTGFQKVSYGWLFPIMDVDIFPQPQLWELSQGLWDRSKIISNVEAADYVDELNQAKTVVSETGEVIHEFPDLLLRLLFDQQRAGGYRYVTEQIKEICQNTILPEFNLSCRNDPVNYDKGVRNTFLNTGQSFKCFNIHALDIIVDSNLKAYFLEMDTSPVVQKQFPQILFPLLADIIFEEVMFDEMVFLNPGDYEKLRQKDWRRVKNLNLPTQRQEAALSPFTPQVTTTTAVKPTNMQPQVRDQKDLSNQIKGLTKFDGDYLEYLRKEGANFKKIGEGASSDVYTVELGDKKLVVKYLKYYRGHHTYDDSQIKEINKELAVMRQIFGKCKNYFSCLENVIQDSQGRLYILMILDENYVTLEDFLATQSDNLTTQQYQVLFLNILDVLEELHKMGVVHRDVHHGNIIFNPENLKVKLIDFGKSGTSISFRIDGRMYLELLARYLSLVLPESQENHRTLLDKFYSAEYGINEIRTFLKEEIQKQTQTQISETQPTLETQPETFQPKCDHHDDLVGCEAFGCRWYQDQCLSQMDYQNAIGKQVDQAALEQKPEQIQLVPDQPVPAFSQDERDCFLVTHPDECRTRTDCDWNQEEFRCQDKAQPTQTEPSSFSLGLFDQPDQPDQRDCFLVTHPDECRGRQDCNWDQKEFLCQDKAPVESEPQPAVTSPVQTQQHIEPVAAPVETDPDQRDCFLLALPDECRARPDCKWDQEEFVCQDQQPAAQVQVDPEPAAQVQVQVDPEPHPEIDYSFFVENRQGGCFYGLRDGKPTEASVFLFKFHCQDRYHVTMTGIIDQPEQRNYFKLGDHFKRGFCQKLFQLNLADPDEVMNQLAELFLKHTEIANFRSSASFLIHLNKELYILTLNGGQPPLIYWGDEGVDLDTATILTKDDYEVTFYFLNTRQIPIYDRYSLIFGTKAFWEDNQSGFRSLWRSILGQPNLEELIGTDKEDDKMRICQALVKETAKKSKYQDKDVSVIYVQIPSPRTHFEAQTEALSNLGSDLQVV